MKTPSKSLFGMFAATVVGISALAVAHEADRIAPESFVPTLQSRQLATGELCPPSACSIVFKTEEGGPPSTVVHID